MIMITDDEFVKTYKPETTDADELFVQRNYGVNEDSECIDLARRELRLWTALYCDNGWQLRSGDKSENDFLYYVICEVPYDLGKEYLVMDEDGEDEEE